MTTNPELSRRGLLQAAGVAGLGSLLTGRTPAQAERPDATTLAGQPALGTIVEPSRHVPVVADCDVCVVGGNVDAARTSDVLSQLQQVASALSLPDARIEPSEHAWWNKRMAVCGEAARQRISAAIGILSEESTSPPPQ